MEMCDAWFVADSSKPRRSIERTQDMHNGSVLEAEPRGHRRRVLPLVCDPRTKHTQAHAGRLVAVRPQRERPRGDGIAQVQEGGDSTKNNSEATIR